MDKNADIQNFQIRMIEPADNPVLAKIVRNTLVEFGANRPGTAYYESSTDALYEIFQRENSAYFVAELNKEIIGGAGIFLSDGLPPGTCELVKMYLVPSARGMGFAKKLMEKCLDFARERGYHQIYLESMPEFKKALSIYEKFGFQYLNGPLGNTGHYACEIWMLKMMSDE
jgi:putative acetyltransferase